jgi:K+-dependent Na+/Ca+ exchanger-like protein
LFSRASLVVLFLGRDSTFLCFLFFAFVFRVCVWWQRMSSSCEGGWEDICLASIDGTWWGVTIEVIVFLYSMLAIAIVADEYLVVSLETLCVRWHVREDVAGATFMAFGSAAPEIIINAITTVRGSSQTDLGVSAIIGSGMIAFLVIPACSIIFVNPDELGSDHLKLKRRPLLRDIVSYGSSLALLCWFFQDGVIGLAEAAVLVGGYILYVLVVVVSPKIRRHYQLATVAPGSDMYKRLHKQESFVEKAERQRTPQTGSSNISSVPAVPNGRIRRASSRALLSVVQSGGNANHNHNHNQTNTPVAVVANGTTNTVVVEEQSHEAEGDVEAHSLVMSPQSSEEVASSSREHTRVYPRSHVRTLNHYSLLRQDTGTVGGASDDREYGTFLSEAESDTDSDLSEDETEESVLGTIYHVVAWPLLQLYSWTCPNCERHGRLAAWYPLTFTVSFFWVAVFSFIVSTIVARWVDLSGVSLSFFGVVLVAAGAEIPDTIQSVTVARRGYGSMAVSNCLGSQITNILMGLGLPWLISNLSGHEVVIKKHGQIQKAAYIQAWNVVLCASLLLGAATIYKQTKARLTKPKGYVMLAFYAIAIGLFAAIVFVLD